MLDISKGFLTISDELTIFPGFSFEQFKHTKFYKNQDGVRIIYLDEQQIIDNRKYIVSLFFRNGKISSDYDARSNVSSIDIMYF